MSEPRIAAIIPTYNEFELLAECIDSILCQNISGLILIVVNAGRPLPPVLADKVLEHRVPDSFYWTACIESGIEEAKHQGVDYCLFTNADTEFLPGSIIKLLEAAEKHPEAITCSPAYIQLGKEAPRLLYSRQSTLGPLLYGRLVRDWERPSDAPTDPRWIELTGGQGVLIPMRLVLMLHPDSTMFPQYASDHDLWLQARKLGYRLLLVPQSGVVNRRDFNEKGGRSRTIISRLNSEFAPESWTIMWRLRRKHQGPLIGFLTTLISFGLRWTIGLPKIIRRS